MNNYLAVAKEWEQKPDAEIKADIEEKYDRQYLWGALQVGSGGSEFLYTNRADGDVSAAFLKKYPSSILMRSTS